MKKIDHVINTVIGVSAATLVVGTTNDSLLGNYKLAMPVAALLGGFAIAGALSKDIKEFKLAPHSALTAGLGTLAIMFGMAAHDLDKNHINVPVNDNTAKAIKNELTSKQDILKIGEDAIYHHSENLISLHEKEKAQQSFCEAAKKLGRALSEEDAKNCAAILTTVNQQPAARIQQSPN